MKVIQFPPLEHKQHAAPPRDPGAVACQRLSRIVQSLKELNDDQELLVRELLFIRDSVLALEAEILEAIDTESSEVVLAPGSKD